MICQSRTCENEVPEERRRAGSPFCSPECRKREKHKRAPSYRKRRGKAHVAAQMKKPFNRFVQATVPGKRVAVGTDERAQAHARTLISAGACAYENRDGLIRDVGKAKKPEDARRIFSAKRDNDEEAKAA